jgi:hypothetical protein
MLSSIKKWFRFKPRILRVSQTRSFIPKHELARYITMWPQSLHQDFAPVALKLSFIYLMIRGFKIRPNSDYFKLKGLPERLLLEMAPARFTQWPEKRRREIAVEVDAIATKMMSLRWDEITVGVEHCPCQFPNPGFTVRWLEPESRKATAGLQVISPTYRVDGKMLSVKDIQQDVEKQLGLLGADKLFMAKFDLMIDFPSILPTEDINYDSWLKCKSLELYNRIK